ncbi:MAG: flagellar biosynthetic protein FliO [Spirochaetales bacterium]|nr:flagellar biosynthetic protein FliO [Spirochaetales bacterium]
MKFRFSLFIIILCGTAIHLSAQDTAQPAETAASPESEILLNLDDTENADQPAVPAVSGTGGIIRALIIFIIILAVIFAFFLLLKKLSGNKFQNNKNIRVISSQALGGSKALHLVELGGEIYLIGAADNGISLVDKIENKEAKDRLLLEISAEKAVHKNSFRDILNSLFSKGAHDSGKMEGTADFIRQQGDRLKKL